MTRRRFLKAGVALMGQGAAMLAAAAAEPIRHRILAADASKRRIALIGEDGRTQWEHPIGNLHDLHLLPNGHVLFQTSWTRLVEVDPRAGDKPVVWSYDAAQANGNAGRRVEVHAFQRLADGVTMIVESGPARILEVDREGRVLKKVALKVNHPNAHSDTRLARKLDNGHYLVSHEADGAIREYDPDGKVVWEYDVPLFGQARKGGHGPEAFGNQAFCALRRSNGNTLIATGNGHSVLEVTPAKEIVWKLGQRDLPGITLAWVTTLQELPGGNLVLGNCHAGPDHPQMIEVTRAKKVVWTFKDFERFGNALSNSRVVDAPVLPQ